MIFVPCYQSILFSFVWARKFISYPERTTGAFHKMVPRKMFGPESEEITGSWRKLKMAVFRVVVPCSLVEV
jgi:hypothetical protein